jgi:hypothetical protein
MWLNKIKEIETEFVRTTKLGKKSNYKRKCQITELKCDNCNNVFQKKLNQLATNRRNNSVKHFCTECEPHSLGGKLAAKIRKEKYDNCVGKKNKYKNGYVEIYVNGTHVFRPNKNWVREHILIIENFIGRKLNKGEVVHHIDGDKHNNDVSNLDLCTVHEHNQCHAKIESIVFELYKKGLVGYNSKIKRYYIK